MQISRHLLLTCAVAMYLTPTWLRAYDNQAQIRARQALEEKMKEVDGQTLSTTSSPPATVTNHVPSAKPKRAQHPKPAPAPAQSSPAVAPEISQPATPRPAATANSANDEKLREALRQKINETPAPATPAAAAPVTPPSQPAPAAAPEFTAPAATANSQADEKLQQALHEKMNETESSSPVPAPATQAPAAPATPIVQPAPHPEPTPSAPTYGTTPESSTNTAANDKLQEALREKMNQTEGNQAASSHPMQPAPAHTKAPTQPMMTLPTLSGPPSSLSPAKQQKLDELLQLYRADRLTPEQYHEQRAKILSEP